LAIRKVRLVGIVADLKTLAGEYQPSLGRLLADYPDRSGDNANRLAEVEALLEHVGEVLELIDTIMAKEGIRLEDCAP
jgi:hypothetical protein